MYFEAIKALCSQAPLTLAINGDCMTGTLPHGGRVKIEHRDVYWPGVVIVYARGDDGLVSHRFLGYVRRRRDWLAITRADNSTSADAPRSSSRILGKVVFTSTKTRVFFSLAIISISPNFVR